MIRDSDRQVVERLKRSFILHGVPLDQTIVFGSRARGDADPDSDLDVLVLVKYVDPSLVLLYAMHRRDRFPSVQACASSGRFGQWSQEAGGKRMGPSGKKIGNAPLTRHGALHSPGTWRANRQTCVGPPQGWPSGPGHHVRTPDLRLTAPAPGSGKKRKSRSQGECVS
jgi:hypothetical protein